MNRSRILSTLAITLVFTAITMSFQSRSGKALWIETKENGVLTSTIALTEGIARKLVESKDKVNFGKGGKRDLVTKQRLESVLNEDEDEVVASDDTTEVRIYLKRLRYPGRERGGNRLVLETRKEGTKTFSITLPEIEIEKSNEDGSDLLVRISIGWKELLPFISKSQGAIYLKNHRDDTEVWLYVE